MHYGNPVQFRLRSKEDISRVYAQGRSKRDGALLVLYVENDQPARPARMAVTVAKRLGTAVRRNHAKRIVREALRLERPGLRGGIDVVLAVQRPTITLEKARRSIRRLSAKLGLRIEAGDGE